MEGDKPKPLKLAVPEIQDDRSPFWMLVNDASPKLKMSVGFRKLWFLQTGVRSLEYTQIHWRVYFIYFLKMLMYSFREKACKQGRPERERERERIPSRLPAVSAEPDSGLELTDREIMTWAEIKSLPLNGPKWYPLNRQITRHVNYFSIKLLFIKYCSNIFNDSSIYTEPQFQHF